MDLVSGSFPGLPLSLVHSGPLNANTFFVFLVFGEGWQNCSFGGAKASQQAAFLITNSVVVLKLLALSYFFWFICLVSQGDHLQCSNWLFPEHLVLAYLA